MLGITLENTLIGFIVLTPVMPIVWYTIRRLTR